MAEKIEEISTATKGIGVVKTAMKGLGTVLSSITEGIREAFSVSGYQGYLQAVKRFGKDLAGELLTLQLSFGKMKVAIAQAFAPLAEVVVPWLNQAIQGVIRFTGAVRQFLSGLMAGISGSQGLSDSTKEASDAQDNLKAAATAAGKAVRRSVLGFDELNRLTDNRSGGTAASIRFDPVEDTVSLEIQEIVNRVLAFLKPLMEIDLAPLKEALARMGAALKEVLDLAGQAFSGLWQQVLAPFIVWVAERFGPGLTNGMAAALEAVAAATAPVMAGLQALWEALQPVVAFIGQQTVSALGSLELAFEDMALSLETEGGYITEIFRNIGQVISGLWQQAQPVLSLISSCTQSMVSTLGAAVGRVAGSILQALAGVSNFVSGVFTGDWKRAWEGIKGFLKGIVNGIIGLLNSMISRLVSALNSVIRTANKLSFTVPSWVPGIGGRVFGVNMKTVSAPQIPYLAKGAVIPPNREFLAVLGDQTHGTNIEAPADLLRQIYREELRELVNSNLAGHEATVETLREILQAVLGIEIGDSVIGRANERYQRRLSMTGGNV